MNGKPVAVVTEQDRRILQEMYKDYRQRMGGTSPSSLSIEQLDTGSKWLLGKTVTSIAAASSDASPTWGQVRLDRLQLPNGSYETDYSRTIIPVMAGDLEYTIVAYNISEDVSYGVDERVWVVSLSNGPFVVIPFSGKSGSGGCCECISIDTGDIVVDGIETTSRWKANITYPVRWKQEHGTVIINVGEYILEWDAVNSYWIYEFTEADMGAEFLSGDDASSFVELGGGSGPDPDITANIIMRRNDSGYTTVKITITGDIPEQGSV